MTPHGQRPSGCTPYTPFEQELVNAINDFMNTDDAPHFDTAAITRRAARRKRTTAIAGIAAALVVAGAGTALATGAAGGSPAPRPAAAAHKPTGPDKNLTTVQYGDIPIQLAGFNLEMAKLELVDKAQLKIGTISKASPYGCKPTSIIAVSPHAPTVVHKGDTVDLTVCAS
jgi:hypothetical protein